MTKVLSLNVTYSARYGSDVDEILLLPLDINGVLFSKLESGVTLDSVVSLGEIEGKHSECYGDLTIDVVNLDELNAKEASQLIKDSYFGEFESYFEEMQMNRREDLDDEEKEAIEKILDKYEIDRNSYGILTSKVHDKFIDELKEKYVVKLKEVIVSEDNYERAVELLKSNGIEVF